MGSEKGSYKIKKFDDTNFDLWKMHMKDYLYQKDLYLLLGEKQDSMDETKWNLMDPKALDAIRLTLSEPVAFNVCVYIYIDKEHNDVPHDCLN